MLLRLNAYVLTVFCPSRRRDGGELLEEVPAHVPHLEAHLPSLGMFLRQREDRASHADEDGVCNPQEKVEGGSSSQRIRDGDEMLRCRDIRQGCICYTSLR